MKILILLSRVPYPLEKGDKLRAYHQIKGLSRNHEIILVALTDSDLHPEAEKELKTFCKHVYVFRLNRPGIMWNLAVAYFSRRPYQVNYFYSRRIHKKIDKLIDELKPDRIYCQLTRMSEYVKAINHIPKTIDLMDAFSKGIERRIKTSPIFYRWIFKQEYSRLKNYEHLMLHYFDQLTIISEQDRDFIAHEESDRIHIIPNGVDTDFFSPSESEKDFELLFTGNMNYPPNIDCAIYLAERVLPIINKKFPKARLLVSGAQPAPKVKALASDRIVVGGWVGDIRESFRRSKIFLAPMQIGTGLQNKLLEAMAMGLPSITSPLANYALGAPEGECILVGHTPEEIAELAIGLLENEDERKKLAEKGRQFVKEHFSWDRHNACLEEIISMNETFRKIEFDLNKQ
jgi:sugar transferase (PEP-CTERM/EpsH1 system associated)